MARSASRIFPEVAPASFSRSAAPPPPSMSPSTRCSIETKSSWNSAAFPSAASRIALKRSSTPGALPPRVRGRDSSVAIVRVRLRTRTIATLESLPRTRGGSAPGVDDRLRAILDAAEGKAAEFHDDFVSIEHLVLGLIEGGGGAADLLKEAGATSGKILEALRAIRGSQR